MTYESPLAYALALEGIALMRAFTGEHDRAFTEARIAEIRRLLDGGPAPEEAVEVAEADAVEGYRIWSATYDGPNPLFDLDAPFIRRVAGALPPGDALDAACGTGRVAELLAGQGYRVTGVDVSPEMLEGARRRVPGAGFRVGDLYRLPAGDGSADLAVCSLALTHLPDLGPALAEFARVLRPGGHLVVTDVHPERVARGLVPPVRLADGSPARLVAHRHRTGDYLRAALAAGFHPLSCEEPPAPVPEPGSGQDAAGPGAAPWETWPWSLAGLVPEAARAAEAGVPAILLWHFRLDSAAASDDLDVAGV
ncbi:class I SAM-dependent methyltransferase [Nocardiopsis potens]|uniref:class I SAM-dependent methyltransferase n=1 Tax=Nocardiopsis potens TaxID=1246458 RepID=UPI00034D06EA|nr:class I SAM-dependent methyltransferase [Nocardiopsis potens]